MATAVFYRQTILMPRAQWEIRRSVRATMRLVDGGVLVLRPIVVTVAILVAAANLAAPTQPGAASDSFTSLLNAVGIGDNLGSNPLSPR